MANVIGTSLNDTLYGTIWSDIIDGKDGNDTLFGNDGMDTMYGGNGDDWLYAGTDGWESMYGGAGNDVYVVADYYTSIYEDSTVNQGIDSIVARGINVTLYNTGGTKFIENIYLDGTANINATGNDLNNYLYGNSGNNILNGGVGIDTMIGFQGDDTYWVDKTSDVVTEAAGEGTDQVILATSDPYTLSANVEKISVDWNYNFSVNITGNALNNDIVGNAYASDNLSGGDGNDTLTGTFGDDTLNGGAGADTMYGGTGNNVFYIDNAGDYVQEHPCVNQGNDIIYSSISTSLDGGYLCNPREFIETLTLTGVANIDGTGSCQPNTLNGNSGNNTLSGGIGNDSLYGNAGNDILVGGLGIDYLNGGAGTDKFVLDSMNSADIDNIADFLVGTDKLQLDDALFTGLTVGSVAAGQFVSGATATAALDSNDRLIYNTTTGSLYYDVDGTGAAAAVKIATLMNKAALDAASFVVV